MINTMRENLVYTPEEIIKMLSNSEIAIRTYDENLKSIREIYVKKGNPLLDLRQVRANFYVFCQRNSLEHMVISYKVKFINNFKAVIMFFSHNIEDYCV